MARHGGARCAKVRFGLAWYGADAVARKGMVRHGKVRFGADLSNEYKEDLHAEERGD